MRVSTRTRSNHDQAVRLLVKSTREAVRREVRRATVKLRSEAKRAAPRATGRLRTGIRERFERDGLRGIVEAREKYSRFVEFGRRPGRMPPPGPIRNWVKVRGLPRRWGVSEDSATFLVQRAIGRRGVKAQPFFFPATARVKREFVRKLRKIVSQAARQIGKLPLL